MMDDGVLKESDFMGLSIAAQRAMIAQEHATAKRGGDMSNGSNDPSLDEAAKMYDVGRATTRCHDGVSATAASIAAAHSRKA